MTQATKNESLATKTHKAMMAIMDATDFLTAAVQQMETLPRDNDMDGDVFNAIQASFDVIANDAMLVVLSLQLATYQLATTEQMAKFAEDLAARNLNSPSKAVRDKTRAFKGMPPEEADAPTDPVN